MLLAPNAQPILGARMRGMKPAELILVSTVGRINEPNHTVYAMPGREYSWAWARGIQVCIYTSPKSNWRPVARAIAAERPSYLAVWDVDNQEGADVSLWPNPKDIERPRGEWRWSLYLFPWLGFQNKEFAWS